MTANVAVSGGFDPVTPGHVELFAAAAGLGPVTVFLNSDEWLLRKKGFFLFSWEERKRILLAMIGIAAVVSVDDSDGTVCAALREHMPTWFVNGGDRTRINTPEVDLCQDIGCALYFSGEKISSSSVVMRRGVSDRSWGKYELIFQGPTDDGYLKIKRLILFPYCSTSRQKHKSRTEYFFPLEGKISFNGKIPRRQLGRTEMPTTIPPGEWHCLTNETDKPVSAIEVQIGAVVDEDDIERKSA